MPDATFSARRPPARVAAHPFPLARRAAGAALLALAAGALFPLASTAQAAPPARVEILNAEFGLFDARNEKSLVFVPTHTVPHREGQRYGWVIELRTRQRAVSVSEEYILPPPPENKPDALAESLGLTNERRTQVSQRRLVPVEGKIYGEWAIGPQEPAGKRTLQVIVEGAEPVRFEYEVK